MVAIALLARCDGATGARQTTTSPAPRNDVPVVVLPSGAEIVVEIANDPTTRGQGLMYRESIAPDRGMLFLFPETGVYPFWMKNTLIPLDMIWIDEQKRIVHVEPNVPPCAADPCPSYPPTGPARYVLELAGGRAAAYGLKKGDPLLFRNTERFAVR
jgi:hypothetical protein